MTDSVFWVRPPFLAGGRHRRACRARLRRRIHPVGSGKVLGNEGGGALLTKSASCWAATSARWAATSSRPRVAASIRSARGPASGPPARNGSEESNSGAGCSSCEGGGCGGEASGGSGEASSESDGGAGCSSCEGGRRLRRWGERWQQRGEQRLRVRRARLWRRGKRRERRLRQRGERLLPRVLLRRQGGCELLWAGVAALLRRRGQWRRHGR